MNSSRNVIWHSLWRFRKEKQETVYSQNSKIRFDGFDLILNYCKSMKSPLNSNTVILKTSSICNTVPLSSQTVGTCTFCCGHCVYLTAQLQTSQFLWSALQLSHRTVLWLWTWFNLYDSTAPSPHFFYKHDLKKKTAVQTVCPCVIYNFWSSTNDIMNSFLCFVSSQRLCLYIMQYPTYITFNWLFLLWSQQYLPICLSLIPESNN